MAKRGVGRSSMKGVSLAERKAALEAELRQIEQQEKEQEKETRRLQKGRKYVANQILSVFSNLFEDLEKTKEKYQTSEGEFDFLVAEFIGKKTAELSASVQATLQRIDRKEKIDQFRKVLLGTLRGSSIDHDTNEEHTEEAADSSHNLAPQESTEKNNLPTGMTMGVVWHLLTSYNLSKSSEVKSVTKKIENREIKYGKMTPSKPEVVSFARSIMEQIAELPVFSLESELHLVDENSSYRVPLYLVMKSFFRYAETSELINNKVYKEMKSENFQGPKSISFFQKALHIPLPSKLEKGAIPVAPEKLTAMAKKINEGGVSFPESDEENRESRETLTLSGRTINMSEAKDILLRGTSTQVLYQLMQRFNGDMVCLAQILSKTKVKKYHDDFIQNIERTNIEIEKIHISESLKELCQEAYAMLTEYGKFVTYYCEITKDPALASWFRTKSLPIEGIRIVDVPTTKTFLKRILPLMGFNRESTHIYAHFIGFLNRAKGDQIHLKSMIPDIEDLLNTSPHTETKPQKTTKKVANNESSLITDWDNHKIETFILEECGLQPIHDLYKKFRNSPYTEIKNTDIHERDKLILAACRKLEALWSQKMITSKDKANLLGKHLLTYMRSGRDVNSVTGMAKRKNAINFARDLRNIITK